MKIKHGELKIMNTAEMVKLFCDNLENDEVVGMDFATLGFKKEDLHGVPAKYLNVEALYNDAWGWNGIRVLESPFDTTDIIVSVGHYGSTLHDVFPIDMEYGYGYEYDISDIGARLRKAVCSCDETIREDTLLIVEMQDGEYKRAEEDFKCEQIIQEQKKKMFA